MVNFDATDANFDASDSTDANFSISRARLIVNNECALVQIHPKTFNVLISGETIKKHDQSNYHKTLPTLGVIIFWGVIDSK